MKKITNTKTIIITGGISCVCTWDELLSDNSLNTKIESHRFPILFSALNYLGLYQPCESQSINQAPGTHTECQERCCTKTHRNERYTYLDVTYKCL